MMQVVAVQTGVHMAQLDDELSALGIPEYSGVVLSGDDVSAIFSSDIDVPTQNIVLDAINGHAPDSQQEIKLYDFVDEDHYDLFAPPLELNYITGIVGRLHPTNSVVVQGEIRQRQYYSDVTLDGGGKVVGYTGLVVQEDIAYARDAIGFADQRTQTISYARKDGTLHPVTKTRVKHYEAFESLIEGKRRRGLLTDVMAMYLSGWLMATQTQLTEIQDRLQLGRDFLRFHSESFRMFVDVSDNQLVYDIRDDAEAGHVWLDSTWDGTQTVREWIDDQVNIWSLP